jgi:hypothetical protein
MIEDKVQQNSVAACNDRMFPDLSILAVASGNPIIFATYVYVLRENDLTKRLAANCRFRQKNTVCSVVQFYLSPINFVLVPRR